MGEVSQTFAISLPVTNVNEAPSISVYLAAGEFTTIGDNSSGPLYELSFDDPDEQDLLQRVLGPFSVPMRAISHSKRLLSGVVSSVGRKPQR
ncbi:hypothetical protein N9P30_02100 [Alphaproteobacteria bacterium]|nr:hypothetical protein [Alphaproteobacteria bacterium]